MGSKQRDIRGSARGPASREDVSCSSASGESSCGKPDRKGVFVKPKLICYEALVDLTTQFGGSLTPKDRESQDLDGY
jgi:hypothetical protein